MHWRQTEHNVHRQIDREREREQKSERYIDWSTSAQTMCCRFWVQCELQKCWQPPPAFSPCSGCGVKIFTTCFLCAIFHWNHAATCSHVHATRTQRLGGKISFAFSCFVCRCSRHRRCRNSDERMKKKIVHTPLDYMDINTDHQQRHQLSRREWTRVWRSLPKCNDSTRNMRTYNNPNNVNETNEQIHWYNGMENGEHTPKKKKKLHKKKNKCSKTFSRP